MIATEDNVSEEKEKTEVVVSKKNKKATLSVEILKVIKKAQQQHGLRHGDYQRYRCYCTRRIKRLRKVLKIPQGDRKHYKKRPVTEAMLKDERFLHIPLMMAERAWGYAMQLRQEANTEPRKKFHLIQRLRKAAAHALHLQKLCESGVCDVRTKLEAQAYVAWILGSLYFELQSWKPAMENLKKAQVVYEKLMEALNDDDQILYKSRVDELTPSLRYCSYNIGEESDVGDLLTMRMQGQGDLLSNLDSLMEKIKQKKEGFMEETEWRGRKVQVRPERVRLFLLADKQLNNAINKASSLSSKIELLENNLMDCKDAIASLRDEIKSDPSSRNVRDRGQPLSSLQYLLSYLTYIRLHRTIERNFLMVKQMKSKEQQPQSNEIKNDLITKEKKVRPEDFIRFFEIILQNVTEMQQLPGLEDDITYQQEVDIKMKIYKAYRCYYIAEYLVTLKRWSEAVALYQRAQQYIFEVKNITSDLNNQVTDLEAAVEGSKFAAHAHHVLEGEVQEDDTIKLTKQFRTRKPLIERLDVYNEDPSLLTKNPNVFKMPQDMKPVPCKPLFFDLAFNFADFPNLDHKLDIPKSKQNPGLTGFVKGLWGWGSSKK